MNGGVVVNLNNMAHKIMITYFWGLWCEEKVNGKNKILSDN